MQSQKKWFRTAAILLMTALLSLGLLTGCGGSSSGGNESSSSSSSTKPDPNPIPTPTPDPTPDSTPEQDPIPNGTVTLPDQTGVYWKVQPTSKTTGTLVGYDAGKSTLPQNLTFPSKLGDYTITAIDRMDFGSANIVELTVPASVTQIANWAFSSMSGLQKATIQGPAQLGSYLFYCCNDLVEVKLNDATTEIPDYAFANCVKLETINFPAKLKTIGNFAFYNVKAAFHQEDVWDDTTGWSKTYQKIELPDGLTQIGESAFESTHIEFVVIPGSVKTIGKNAFKESYLYYAELSEGVEQIGDGAFYGDFDLRGIYLPRSIQSIGEQVLWRRDGETTRIYYAGSESDWQKMSVASNNDDLMMTSIYYGVAQNAFDAMPNDPQPSDVRWEYEWFGNTLTITGYDRLGAVPTGDIEFPAYVNTVSGKVPVTCIGNSQYYVLGENSTVTSIKIPETVKTIEGSAFKDCKNLVSVSLPEGLETINQEAFYGCTVLSDITLSRTLKYIGYGVFYECSGLRSINLPEGLETIGGKAFYKTRISEVTVPASVTKLDWSAFSWNDDLLTATIKGAPQLGSGVFQYCTNLQSVKLNDAITEIPDEMFSGCHALNRVNLSSQLKRIGKSAFRGTKIKELKLPDTVTQIGEEAFSFSSLEKIALSKSMKSIPVKAFSYSSLKQMYIPASITSIDREAFNAIYRMTDIYYGGSDWSNVEINATGNDVLTDGTVTVHCNASSSDLGLMETTSLLSLFGF